MSAVRIAGVGTRAGAGREALSLRDGLRARAYASTVPLSVTVEVTKRCNLRCRHCYVAAGADVLDTARVLGLFGELREAGTVWVSLTGGEVSARSDWLELVAGVKRHDMVVSVLTNGADIPVDELDALIALRPARVSVSIYGGDAATHEAVTGVAGSFERSVASLRRLRESGIRCRVACPLMEDTIDGFRSVVALADSLGCEYQFDPTISPMADGDRGVTGLRVPAERLAEFFLDETILHKSKEGQLAVRQETPAARVVRNCSAGFTTAFIEADGSVYPCMGFPPAFGNLSEGSFADIWRSPVAEAHRSSMRRPLCACGTCDLSGYCTARCPRLAAVEDGDLSGASKRACELASLARSMHATLLNAQHCVIQ